MSERTALNCIDIVEPYANALILPGMPKVQLMGGVGSVALQHEATMIDFEESRVIAPKDLYLSNFRDQNKLKNIRDIETMVLSNRPEDVGVVESVAREAIGGQLKIETFAFKSLDKIEKLVASPLGVRALALTWLSDRYMPGQKIWAPGDNDVKRVLFPFATSIPDEALDTWTLEINGRFELPIPSPAASLLNYFSRSMSGVRKKDGEKVGAMAHSIFDKSKDALDWILDGPGRSQFEMARILQTLREPSDAPESLTIGNKLTITPYELDELHTHPAFMLRESDTRTRTRALGIAHLKSRLLRKGESSPLVVDLWQKRVEPLIKSIIHND